MTSKLTEPNSMAVQNAIDKILQESSTITNKLSTKRYIPKEDHEGLTISSHYYSYCSKAVKLFKAIAISAIIYYVSNNIISKLSEIMNGYQDQLYSVNRDVSSLVSEMRAMMQGRLFFDFHLTDLYIYMVKR